MSKQECDSEDKGGSNDFGALKPEEIEIAITPTTGGKRRKFEEGADDALSQVDGSQKEPASATNLQPCKRSRLEECVKSESQYTGASRFTHWLAFDLLTAGSQVVEMARDQAPITQLSAVLGHVPSKRIIGRFIVNIHADSYVKTLPSSDCAPHTAPPSANQLQSSSLVDDGLRKPTFPDLVMGPSHIWQASASDRPTEDVVNIDVKSLSNPLTASSLNKSVDRFSSPNLSDAMSMLMSWLESKGAKVGETAEEATLVLITEGHFTVRNILHAEAAYRGITQAIMSRTPWCTYVDVLSCYQRIYRQNTEENKSGAMINDLTEAAAAAGIDLYSADRACESASRVENIASLTNALIEKDLPLCEPEVVRTGYMHKIFPRSMRVEDDHVVEVRQVPWSATPSIIAGFFAGLNVAPGGVAIRLTDGRRSNTAIVAFDSAMHAKLALARHQHQLCGSLLPETLQDGIANSQNLDKSYRDQPQSQQAQKPITLQVYSASGREFVQCAGCDQPAVAEFLSQLTSGEQVVVRVRGLPYTVTKQQILEFFTSVSAAVLFDGKGIYLVAYPDRRPTGDAFVLFNDDVTATKALLRHKDYLGDRYVELFKASPSEMVQVCYNVSQQSHSTIGSHKQHNTLLDLQARTRNVASTISLASACNSLGPFFTKDQKMAAALEALKPALGANQLSTVPMQGTLLNPSLFPIGLQNPLLASGGAPLDSVVLVNALTANVPTPLPSPLSLPRSSNLLSSVIPSSGLGTIQIKQAVEPVTKDLTDPTDPECSFARPLPAGGVTAMLQLSALPLETSRHDVRLYLGPANFAKVYRMRCMEPAANATSSTWLLSLLNTTEAILLIRDLVNRPFSLGNGAAFPNQIKVFPNVPTFSLYHVSPEKRLLPISLEDPSFGIPLNRVYGSPNAATKADSNIDQRFSSNAGVVAANSTDTSNTSKFFIPTGTCTEVPGTANCLVPQDSTYSQVLQNLMTQSQLMNLPNSASGRSSLPYIPGLSGGNSAGNSLSGILMPNPINTLPAAILFPQNPLTTSAISPPSGAGQQHNIGAANGGMVNSACMAILTGVPQDASADELSTLFLPIRHLLSVPPHFILYQNQPNGTANFLAIFASPLEAQTAASYCPHGNLRGNRYAVGVACLVPTSPMLDSSAMPYNPLSSNLMFLSPPISNTVFPR